MLSRAAPDVLGRREGSPLCSEEGQCRSASGGDAPQAGCSFSKGDPCCYKEAGVWVVADVRPLQVQLVPIFWDFIVTRSEFSFFSFVTARVAL